MNLRNMRIDELIIHDIPARLSRGDCDEDVQERGPILSEAPSEMDIDVKEFFRLKIQEAIGSSKAVAVQFDEGNGSPVKCHVETFFEGSSNLCLEASHEIAKHLFAIQTRRNPDGLLLLVRCLFEGRNDLAILKLEREEGVKVEEERDASNRRILTPEHIQNLMITKGTRLFKIAYFYKEGGVSKGVLVDNQRGFNDVGVAEFFLSDFLGCRYSEEPKVKTREFFDLTARYINKEIEDAVTKSQTIGHLMSEMQSQSQTLSPQEFSRRALSPETIDSYRHFMEDGGFTMENFSKNVELVDYKKLQYSLDSGISIVGPADVLENRLSISSANNHEDRHEKVFEIKDRLKTVKAR